MYGETRQWTDLFALDDKNRTRVGNDRRGKWEQCENFYATLLLREKTALKGPPLVVCKRSIDHVSPLFTVIVYHKHDFSR